MALNILSTKVEAQDEVFKSIALSALRGKLFFLFTEWAVLDLDRIELSIQKNSGMSNQESFSIDVLSEKEQMSNSVQGLLDLYFEDKKYFMIAGTDDIPSHLGYIFSLTYLRIQPDHKIVIDENYFFGLNDIEKIESSSGWYEDWYYSFDD